MKYVVCLGPILVGFLLGYFLSTPLIVALTGVAVIAAFILRPRRKQELGALVGAITLVVMSIGMVTMWFTHLYVTDTLMTIPDVSQYIFRQE